jgi:hypothetical protein
VLHGRNQEAATAMQEWLRSLGLRPLAFRDAAADAAQGMAANSQIVDDAFAAASAAIVLWTSDEAVLLDSSRRQPTAPDDDGRAAWQPRPNVIFELGLAYARLPGRTLLVRFGGARIPSDLAGLDHPHLASPADAPKFRRDLARRLESLGVPVDRGGAWRTAGDFAAVLEREASRPDTSWIRAGNRVSEVQPYRYRPLLDDQCEEVFITGHNFSDVLERPDPSSNLASVIKGVLMRSSRVRVTLAFAPPALLKEHYPLSFDHLIGTSLPRLWSLWTDPDLRQRRRRLVIGESAAALTFPCFIRDPMARDKRRGVLIATPRWLHDRTGGARMFFALHRDEHEQMFAQLSAEIVSDLRTRPSSQQLEQLVARYRPELATAGKTAARAAPRSSDPW